MGDMKEEFNALREHKQKQHQDNFDRNLAILIDSGLPFKMKETAALFRITPKPKVDFYPHTGRWKVKNKVYRGGAIAFLRWYEKQ